jgi:hypothetical protein
MPNQIGVDQKEKTLTLNSNSETPVNFTVSSLGALPGGNYYVFTVLDYEEDGNHYSVISNGRILTSKERSYMGILAPIIVAIVVILVIALIYMQLRQEKPVKPVAEKPAEVKPAAKKK